MNRKLFILSIALLHCVLASAQRHFTYKGQERVTSNTCLLVTGKTTNARHHTYRTVQEALHEAEMQSAERQRHISVYIMPAVYWMDNPDDPSVRKPRKGSNTPFAIELTMSNVSLFGLGDTPDDVVLAVNRGQTQGADGNYTMFYIAGNDIEAENITFGNYCNVDLTYPRDPRQNRPKRKDAIVQAQIGICSGQNYSFSNCRFISRLNLCPFIGAENTTYTNCYFECTDDALNGDATYTQCRFTLFSSKPFYSTDRLRGAKFVDCDLHAKTHGTQYLTKVSGPVEMTRCRWTSDDPNLKIEWNRRPDPRHRCVMTDCTLNGQPLIVPQPTDPLPVALPPLPVAVQRDIRPGQWTIDCHKPTDTSYYDWQPDTTRSAWGYAQGVDGAEGLWGLVQIQRGARLMFTPANENAEVKDQSCIVELDPCKGPGQGFGSATGQYLDICIKFDTRTLTGYGLRLERTPDYDKAVVASLVEYSHGTIRHITTPEKCVLFRPGCTLKLSTSNGEIWAVISNKNADTDSQTLHAPMPHPNTYGGFHLQHTGSTGASATVVRKIELR